VKATNILLDVRCNAKLSDVGLAKAAPTLEHTHVSTLRLLGTPGFIDPLVVETGQYSPTSDAFALGKVLLMCLTGKDVMAATEAGEEIYESLEGVQSFSDPSAEWPPSLTRTLAQVVIGLAYLSRKQRMGLDEALAMLEELSTNWQVRLGTLVSDSAFECIVCMAEPRAVRFVCGHCTCCEACANNLVARGASCPSCRCRIRIVERGPQLNEASSFVVGMSWLQQHEQEVADSEVDDLLKI
jgi:hypothetical protein